MPHTTIWRQILSAAATAGHFYWTDGGGRVCVADDSIRGGDPACTDDGLLFLDRAGLRRLVTSPAAPQMTFCVPVRKRSVDGETSAITAGFREAQQLVCALRLNFGMLVDLVVEVDGARFRLVEEST